MVHINFVCKQCTKLLKILFGVVFVILILSIAKEKFPHSYYRENALKDYLNESKQALENQSIVGSLNIHRWYSTCGFLVDNLRDHVFFPNQPDLLSTINNLTMMTKTENFGQRIFGYLQPPSSGLYKFAISSDDCSELWLSSDNRPDIATLRCYVGGHSEGKLVIGWTKPGDFNKYESQISREIFLTKGKKYFIEVLHKQARDLGHVQVVWKLPDSDKFEDISSDFLSTYMGEKMTFPDVGLKQHKNEKMVNNGVQRYEDIQRSLASRRVSYLRDYHSALPKCVSSNEKIKLKRYEGIHVVHTAYVYPPDGSNTVLQACENPHVLENCKGNPLLERENASRIINKYINATLPLKYSLRSIIRVELFKKPNSNLFQYFVDFRVIDKTTGELSRITESVWEYPGNKMLCNPGAKTSWNPDAMVYLILTAKNQGLWVRHFIDTLVYIQEETDDSRFHPIIIDYGSEDVGPNDADIYLKQSKLKHYTVIHKTGRFYKTAAINEAAASVKDENSILLQVDLHLDLPLNLIDTVRKHTIQGKVAFTPILTRLSCGSYTTFPVGFWEDRGFGLFAIYKSDWIRFGGMNDKEFRNKWGGEDWEMLDRVLMHNISVHIEKLPGLFHHFHTKHQLWHNAA